MLGLYGNTVSSFQFLGYNNRLISSSKFLKIVLVDNLPSAFNTHCGAGAFAMTSKDGKGAYVQRGTDLFELTCTADDCTWITMPMKFSNDLRYGVAMHLTEDWDGLCP